MSQPILLPPELCGVFTECTQRVIDALTHPSFANENPGAGNYQRLEFLGDAVLGLCVSELLLARHPGAPEGTLTRMRSGLVNTQALAGYARHIDLARFVRFGRGAAASGDHAQPKVLADVVEALVGAAFLDLGVDAARRLTELVVEQVIAHRSELGASDPKSRLQEILQAKALHAPEYSVVSVSGPPHERTFEVAVHVGGEPVAVGSGRSKKQAEQAAAALALQVANCEGDNK